jgi:anaerobic dimethyl sulfoxide reductase subunit A
MVGDRIEATKSDRITVAENSNLIVQWGVNPSWTKFGSQQTYRAAKERGCKVYNVGPWLAPGSAAFVDEWIPCRPGTDTALLLAIAYVAISEGLIDEDWVNAHCVGYDHLHMPLRDSNNFPILDGNGVSVIEPSGSWGPGNALTGEHHRYWQENFKDYVLGTYDGVPKTPAWASAICGAPVNKIISLAKDMALIKPMAVISGDAPARVYHGGSYAQAFFAIGMLCGKGNIGVPGGRLDDPGLLHFGSYQYFSRNDRFISGWYLGLLHEQLGDTLRSPAFPVAPAAPVTTPATTAGDRPRNPKGFISYGAIRQPWATLYGNYQANEYYGIGFAEVWDAILTGEHHDPGHTRYNMDDTELLPGHGKKKVDIRAILKIDITNCVNQVVNTNKAVQAMRSPKVEFIAATDFYMTSTLRYADIILPCISFWEHEGHYSFLNPEIMIGNPERVIAPMFECRADTDVDAELCKIAGVDPKFAAPYTEKQAMFNALANAYVFKTDGTTKEPLVKFTANDIYDLGVDADTSPTSSLLTEGRITYQEFKEKGLYQVRMTEKTKQNEGWLKDLVENGTPLTANYTTRFTGTETGKVELYCMKLKRYHDLVYSFGTTHLDPLPKYQADTAHGYEATQALNAEYPLQCYSVHPYHRIHSQRSDNSSVVELCDDIATINVLDAQRYGISNGDWVLIESEAGKILRRASVVSTIMPGVMQTTEGATARYNYGTSGFEDESIDIGGNANTLTYSLLCGEGHQAYNSVVVKISRWTGTPPLPQYKWEPDLPRMASE